MLVSLAVVAFGVLLFSKVDPGGLKVSPLGSTEKIPVERVRSPELADAPEAVAELARLETIP